MLQHVDVDLGTCRGLAANGIGAAQIVMGCSNDVVVQANPVTWACQVGVFWDPHAGSGTLSRRCAGPGSSGGTGGRSCR